MSTFTYPEAGEVWEWDSSPPQVVYMVGALGRYSNGRRMQAIRLHDGQVISVFFRREHSNGWERIA